MASKAHLSVVGGILLGDVLSPAELEAARLDGDVYRLGDGFRPVDLPDTAAARAASLAREIPRRLIAHGGTAAWIWRALSHLPRPLECCHPVGTTAPGVPMLAIRVRERRLADEDVAIAGGMRVTTPLRTALDLIRVAAASFDREAVIRLLRGAGLGRDALEAAIESRPGLHGRSLALQRLETIPSRC